MDDRQITPHFKLSEFDCKDGTPYPAEWIDSRLVVLCGMDEIIRHEAGDHAMTVLCGFRTPSYNGRLRARGLTGEDHTTGVATQSRHMFGDANDISIYGLKTADLHDLILVLYKSGKLPMLGGLGFYPGLGFCHVDLYKAPDGHLRRWNG
jgi:uncharacterized protein YcbK (DUF882 family)